MLMVSEHRSLEIAKEAIHAGAHGYLVKSYAGSELFSALGAVLNGDHFASAGVEGDIFGSCDAEASRRRTAGLDANEALISNKAETEHDHEVAFYPSDLAFIDGFAEFARCALQQGNPVIVVATSAHRTGIVDRLRQCGIDVDAASKNARFVQADSAELLSKCMQNGVPVPACMEAVADSLVGPVVGALSGCVGRIAICGELAPTLLADGKIEEAIEVERYFDQVARRHNFKILCGYLLGSAAREGGNRVLQRICAEHSDVHIG
jgi:hypothetical protein